MLLGHLNLLLTTDRHEKLLMHAYLSLMLPQDVYPRLAVEVECPSSAITAVSTLHAHRSQGTSPH